MDPITQQTVLAAAGAGGDPLYVDEVFSTTIFDHGSGGSVTVNTGIDNTEKSLVWVKARGVGFDNILRDTEANLALESNSLSGGTSSSSKISSFTSTGFESGASAQTGGGGGFNTDFVTWNFKAQKGFFDVVTYNGQSNGGTFDTWITVPHDLGSSPGMVIIKCTTATSGGYAVQEPWIMWHRSLPTSTGNLNYDQPVGTTNYNTYFGRPAGTVDANNIYVRAGQFASGYQGFSYVAYIFAHDDAKFGTANNQSIINCGKFTGNTTVNLGFEPQWILLKSTSTGNWDIHDTMRGWPSSGDAKRLRANLSDAESETSQIYPNATGFSTLIGSDTYIYMAIRRPHKPPELATKVFAVDTKGGTSPNPPTFNSGFPVDWSLYRNVYGSHYWLSSARLMGNKYVDTASTNAQNTFSTNLLTYDRMDGMGTNTGSSIAFVNWMFKRAEGFFDVVMYDGSHPSIQNVVHNLGVAPEFIMIKAITQQRDWATYVAPLGTNKYIKLNSTDAPDTSTSMWNNTAPTSSVFTLGNNQEVNSGSVKYIAYLFATLPGISKIGTYAGSDNTVNVDCGFTNGARFVMIRRIDSGSSGWNTATGWYIWDTKRGIVSGDDPYIYLNSSGAQTTGTDYIDPLSTGFSLRGSSNNVNDNGRSYFFLAIA